MADRFQKLYSLSSSVYCKGCPVIIEAGALHKDRESDSVIAQLKMRNIGEQSISSCKVSIRAYENNGRELEGIEDYSYLDLSAKAGDVFGGKEPIIVPNKTTRRIEASIKEIVFSDGTVKTIADDEWEPVPARRRIEDYFNNEELVKQYRLEVKGPSDFFPEKTSEFFFCTCGAVNLSSAEKCYNCSNTYENLKRYLDLDFLSDRVAERHAREKSETEKKKTMMKKLVVAAISVMTVLALVTLVSSIIKANNAPDIMQGSHFGDSYDKVLERVKKTGHEFDANENNISENGVNIFGQEGDLIYTFNGGPLESITFFPDSRSEDTINDIEKLLIAEYGEPEYDQGSLGERRLKWVLEEGDWLWATSLPDKLLQISLSHPAYLDE